MTERTRLWLIRHGETAWSVSGKHTGRTDIPLTEQGRRRAEAQAAQFPHFEAVFTSPLQRAKETCRLAGYRDSAIDDPDLMEWDYGIYEGLTTAEIRADRPGWSIWESDVPGGESLSNVRARAEGVIERAAGIGGDVALFSHGHFLRILTACWLGLPPNCGRLFALEAGAVSILGYERETRVIRLWNRATE